MYNYEQSSQQPPFLTKHQWIHVHLNKPLLYALVRLNPAPPLGDLRLHCKSTIHPNSVLGAFNAHGKKRTQGGIQVHPPLTIDVISIILTPSFDQCIFGVHDVPQKFYIAMAITPQKMLGFCEGESNSHGWWLGAPPFQETSISPYISRFFLNHCFR